MKRPVTAHRLRPPSVARRVPRTRSEAAVELVRLEFDAARLERELGQLGRRVRAAETDLKHARARADAMLARLTGGPAG